MPVHYLFNYFCGMDYISLVYPGAWRRLFFECFLTIGFCSATYLLIERPMIQLGNRISKHRAGALPPALSR
jgi:peptidoglycan/LPS O-acetylase OafA/YrhL